MTPGESETYFIASSSELGGTKSSSSLEAMGGPNKDAMSSGRKPTLGKIVANDDKLLDDFGTLVNCDAGGNGGRSRGKLNVDCVGELSVGMLVGRDGLGQDKDGGDNNTF